MTQDEYIAILFNDCGFDTAVQRRGFMLNAFGCRVNYTDELTSNQRSRLIRTLKDIKDRREWFGKIRGAND